MYRKQLSHVINNIINEVVEEVKPELIDDYKKLNDKCDIVIYKIKVRKQQEKK